MYVLKKDGKHYVHTLSDGLTYINTANIEGTTAFTIYMPDGTLLTNASVTVNDTAYTTDANGKVYLTGEYDKPVMFDIVHENNYKGSVQTTYGTDETITLIQWFLLTVTASGFRYSSYFTITTTIDGVSYTGSQSIYVPAGTSVTVRSVDNGNGGLEYSYHSAYVKVDGTSTGTQKHTFTMDADHTITFTDGKYTHTSIGT